jgi:hypothetical protein
VVTNMLNTLRHSSWIQRLFALVLACNSLLILWGLRVEPAMVTINGIATTLATVGMQVAIAFLAFFGPLSFQRYPAMGISVAFGTLFAVIYDGILLSDYVPRLNLDFNIWLLFLGIAGIAGFIAGYQTRRIGHGVVVAIWALVIGTAIWSIGLLIINYAFWGNHQWLFFWQNDGAVDDFHQSGASNLSLFIMQDMQGALFFHPLLSAFLGAVVGLVASGAAQGLRLVRRQLAGRTAA